MDAESDVEVETLPKNRQRQPYHQEVLMAASARETIQLNSIQTEGAPPSSSATTPDPAIGGGSDMCEAIMEMVRPAVVKLDEQVKNTRKSQLMLANHINQLSSYLKVIGDEQSAPYDLDAYVRKLDDSRKRVSSMTGRLQIIHERMSQLQRNIARETFRQKQQLNKS
ncbi:snapin/Pallidin domain-containing protein [Ditylenchus destructor]|nr:snapin/Pallidin domain-containing protein [Ditylenchus destructor]